MAGGTATGADENQNAQLLGCGFGPTSYGSSENTNYAYRFLEVSNAEVINDDDPEYDDDSENITNIDNKIDYKITLSNVDL
jgi:hypothetical protein